MRAARRALISVVAFTVLVAGACAPPAPTTKASAVTSGGTRGCALTVTGGVMCWGNNRAGQLGNGVPTESPTPVEVVDLGGEAVAVSTGTVHTCALTAAGAVRCWGDNFDGQLGDGTRTDRTTPVGVTGLEADVTAISTSGSHTCALTTAGAVQCWGDNSRGQLGDGTTTTRSTPVPVLGLESGVAAITAGEHHTCALTTAGAVQCWGDNNHGQLGDGTRTGRTSPAGVTDLDGGVTAITTRLFHTCATTTSDVKCWGWNGVGQLGDGTTTNRTTPVSVVGLDPGVAAVSAGGVHTCALSTAGAVTCWGNNGYGELGDGTTTERTSPVPVRRLGSGVTAISAGWQESCALTASGAVRCWGSNDSGQLGDGTRTAFRSTPVNVVGIG